MRMPILAVTAALVVVFLLPASTAQPPALQPRIETHPQWSALPGGPDARSAVLPASGALELALDAGSRIFVSGGWFVCQQGTVYEYALTVVDPGISWGTAVLTPDDARQISVAVPEGAHEGGWPGPTEWHFQDGPTLAVRWDIEAAPADARVEYRIALDGQPSLASGGCVPDPLDQPARHVDETVNITRPALPPKTNATETPDECPTDCVTMVPLEEDAASPSLGPMVIILSAVALSVLRARRD